MKKRLWVSMGIIIGLILIVVLFSPTIPVPQITKTFVEPETTIINYKDISVFEAKILVDNNPDLIIIDVSPNYGEGHIPKAINYYVGDGSLDEAISMLDKEGMYLVYCHFESASRRGAQKLVEAGFRNVYRLDGDYGAWVYAGYEIEY